MADATLAHEQVWDDTDLVQSWNDAFAEYKKYHSLALQGAQVSKSPPPAPENLTNGNADNATLTDGRKQVQYADSQEDSDEYAPSVGLASKSGQDAPASAPAAAETLKAMLAGVQDEAMKNLMMSWYYAGYYTGLYEGKQQGYARAVGEKPSGG